MLNIQVISKEIIKPSLATPTHLRTLKLSLLDQIAPSIYIPIILFYQFCESKQTVDQFERSFQLKKSLAETLTRFYPLAGTMKDDSFIECNDVGIEYFEASLACKLSDIIQTSNGNVLNEFLPFEPYGNWSSKSEREALLAVKSTIFDCGGVAIGVCVSHKIADGTSLTTFVNAWAATSRGASEASEIIPRFDVATHHFPPTEISGCTPNTGIIVEEKIVSRRFVFGKSSIDALKEKVSSAVGSPITAPTRVEAVSAFICGRLMAVERSKREGAKVFAMVHAVGLRDRMVPPLPTHSFGNLWRVAVVAPFIVEDEIDYHELVRQLRDAIKEFNGDYIKKLQDSPDDYLEQQKKCMRSIVMGEVEFAKFSSWVRFPVYEVDFGWGKPTWVCSPNRPYKNLVTMMSNRDGDGIEAWVHTLEDDMAVLERDTQLLSFTSKTI